MNASTTMRAAATCALLATTCLSTFAYAQALPDEEPVAQTPDPSVPSAYKNIDENGVDLTDGSFNFSMVEGSIGSGEGALSLIRYDADGSSLDNWNGLSLIIEGTSATVTLGNRSETFTNLQPDQANGATLTGGGSYYTYRDSDGTEILFASPEGETASPGAAYCSTEPNVRCELAARSIREPNGKTVALRWDVGGECGGPGCVQARRLSDVANNLGYGLAVAYPADAAIGSPAWFRRTSVTFRNSAMPGTPMPAVLYSEPSPGVTQITTTGGRTWRITTDADGRITGIKRPGAASDSTQVTYGANGVTQVTHEGVTTDYAHTVNGDVAATVVSDAVGTRRTVMSNLASGRPTQVTDALGRTTLYGYDGNERLTETTAPEGNKIISTYDARGNVIKSIARAKGAPGSADPLLADIVTQAGYDETCANAAVCNQPRWTRDAAGAQTDYGYDALGNVTSVTAPAPAAGAARPQVRYSYGALTAPVSGTVTMLTAVSACTTGLACVGTADEVLTTIGYSGFNLQPNVVRTGAGDGSLTARTVLGYDAIGNLNFIDGPLTDVGDVTRAYYNASREAIGTIGPDPDGTGPLRHRAQRIERNADGDVVAVFTGTAVGQGDDGLAGMTALDAVHIAYDGHRRPIYRNRVEGGVVTEAVGQSHDARGRPDCTAVRMDYARLTAATPACSVQTPAGPYGPDRVTKTLYDAADRPTQRIVAVGTADEASEASATYSPNGRLETLVDGNDNLTRYVYDAHDRLSRTLYPVATPGARSANPGDYEELSYDARSNVTQVRVRDGQLIDLTYDALGRMTFKTLPGGAWDSRSEYRYDNLGRLTYTTYPGSLEMGFAYDALGRKTAEGSNWYGQTNSEYDLAGRRTRLTWRDGFAVDYTYLVTGEMASIKEAGGFELARFGYDDRGRRTLLTRGNGTSTSYAYHLGSRLRSLGQDLAGTSHDLSLTFDYNPASQIVEATRSNDLYAMVSAVIDLPSAVNGLNQLTQHGVDAVTHDARGNLVRRESSTLITTYGYTAENRLTTKSGFKVSGGQVIPYPSTDLAYDPLGRLIHLTGSATDFRYDGSEVIEESVANTGALRKRFVHGPGVDEPLVVYDANGAKRWFHADERGSIIATSDATGTAATLHRYDEYGVPQDALGDRFGYTGQMWLPEAGIYSYKARMYDPQLGRFLQSDPIGYEAGMNLYAYVGGDPVNFTDPTGLTSRAECLREQARQAARGEEGEPVVCGGGGGNDNDNGGGGGGGGRGEGGGGEGRGGIGGGGGAVPSPQEPDIVVTARRQRDFRRCAATVGSAALRGLLDPIGAIGGLVGGFALGWAAPPPSGGTVEITEADGRTRTMRLARVGVRASARTALFRVIPGAAAGAIATGIIAGGVAFFREGSCR